MSLSLRYVAAILFLVASAGASHAKKANTHLSSLVASSSMAFKGRVMKVENRDGIRVATAVVDTAYKGTRPGRYVTFLATGTWTCDTSDAVVGESAFLFLKSDDPREQNSLKDPVLKAARKALKGKPLYLIMHSGSGRIPIVEEDETSFIRARHANSVKGQGPLVTGDQVMLPKEIEPAPGVRLDRGWIEYLAVPSATIDLAIRKLLAPRGPSTVLKTVDERASPPLDQKATESELLLAVLDRYSESSHPLYVGFQAESGDISDLDPAVFRRAIKRNSSLRNASALVKPNAPDKFALTCVSRPTWKSRTEATVECTTYTTYGGFGTSPYTYALRNGKWSNIDKTMRVACGVSPWVTINGKRVNLQRR